MTKSWLHATKFFTDFCCSGNSKNSAISIETKFYVSGTFYNETKSRQQKYILWSRGSVSSIKEEAVDLEGVVMFIIIRSFKKRKKKEKRKEGAVTDPYLKTRKST